VSRRDHLIKPAKTPGCTASSGKEAFAMLKGSTAGSRHTTSVGHAPACVERTGDELEQIQFLLGHVTVQTTERYLGCSQPIAALS
jgi:integrase